MGNVLQPNLLQNLYKVQSTKASHIGFIKIFKQNEKVLVIYHNLFTYALFMIKYFVQRSGVFLANLDSVGWNQTANVHSATTILSNQFKFWGITFH